MENNINVIINDLRELRGKQVKVFGQPTTLDSGYDDNDLIVDTIDVLTELRGYEVELDLYEDDINNMRYEESEDGEIEEFEFDTIDSFMENMQDLGYIDWDNGKGDNSYNYGGYFSNDLNWHIYKSLVDNRIYVELKAHRFGDVRGNYTDTVLLEFQDDYTFYEIISEGKYIDIVVNDIEYNISCNGLSDEVSIYDRDASVEYYHSCS